MTRICKLTITLVILLCLTACIGPIKVKTPEYSLGPVSSQEFSILLQEAIPADEGEVHVAGQIEWFGLESTGHFPGVGRYLKGVAAITDTDILLLGWHEPEEQYKIVARIPYSEINAISTSSKGVGRAISLYFEDQELSLGDRDYKMGRRTFINFVKPSSIWVNKQKNEVAYNLLKDKIKPYEKTYPPSDQSFDDEF